MIVNKGSFPWDDGGDVNFSVACSEKIPMRFLSNTFFTLLLFSLLGCGSKTAKERMQEDYDRARPRAAAYGADTFMKDTYSPEPRPFYPWQFYFKDCALVSRNPYPSTTEYACSDPH